MRTFCTKNFQLWDKILHPDINFNFKSFNLLAICFKFAFLFLFLAAHHHRTTNNRLFRIYVCAHSCQLPPYNFHNFWIVWRISVSWKISGIGKSAQNHFLWLSATKVKFFIILRTVYMPKIPFWTLECKISIYVQFLFLL